MSSSDNFVEEMRRLHIIAQKRKAAKTNRIKVFLKRNKWKILMAGLVTAFLMYISSIPNVGYTSTIKVDINSAKLIIEHHPCYGYILNGYVNASFNPFIYPISHLTGQGKISGGFARWSGSTFPDPQSPQSAAASVAESIMIETWLTESARNLPYMGFVGVVTAFGTGRIFEKIKSHFRRSTF